MPTMTTDPLMYVLVVVLFCGLFGVLGWAEQRSRQNGGSR